MNYEKLIEKSLQAGYAVRIYVREWSEYLNAEVAHQAVSELCSLIKTEAQEDCEIMINRPGADWSANAAVWIKMIDGRAYGSCRAEELREFCDCEIR